MSGYAHGIVTVEDYIDCGLRLHLSAGRTLQLYREMGGQIRTQEFMDRWNGRKAALLALP
jgi:hypothetical protein